MLVEELACFRERQFLRIVAGKAETVARREFRHRARERILKQFAATLLLVLDRVGAAFVGAGFSLRIKLRRTAIALATAVSRPTGRGEFIVWQRLKSSPGAEAIDVPLRKHCPQPGRQAAASVKITKKRSFEQLAIDAIGEIPCTT